MWALAVAAAATAHVPIYPDGSLYVVDRDATISQVIYSPGAQIQVEVPKKFLPDDELHVDLIVRDKVDMDKLRFAVSCDATLLFSATPRGNFSLQEGKLEAFTQTSYFSVLEGEDHDNHRVGPAIDVSGCSQALTIVAAHTNVHETHGPIGIVIGHTEEFTFGELMSFGHYALMNHGFWWN